MPYEKFRKGKKYCIRNKRTGKVTCYSSVAKRETGIRMKHAFAHGFVPTRINVKKHKRKGRTVRNHKRRR